MATDKASALLNLRSSSWRPWRETAILAIMVMELGWVVPWYRSLTPATYAVSPWRAFLVLGGILFFTHWLIRTMNYLKLRMSLRRWILIGSLVVSILLGLRLLLYQNDSLTLADWFNRPLQAVNDFNGILPNEFIITFIVLVACWRGLTLGQEYIEPTTVRKNFVLGIIMFIAFIFINTIATGEKPGWLLNLFFLAGLIGLGAARISVLSGLRGGGSVPFDKRWFVGMFLTSLGVVTFASLMAWFFSERVLFIVQIGGFLLGIVGLIMVAVISPAIYILQTVVSRSAGQSQAMQGIVDALRDLQSTMQGIAINLYNLLNLAGVFEWAAKLKSILIISILILVGLVIVASLLNWILKDVNQRKEVRQALTGGELLRLLQEALQNQFHRLVENIATRASFRSGLGFLAAAKVRRIYAQLMDLAESLGRPRPPSQTPLEFLPALDELFPGSENDLKTITQAYLQVRYGELPETRLELDPIEAAWDRVRIQGQNQIREKMKSRKSKRIQSNQA